MSGSRHGFAVTGPHQEGERWARPQSLALARGEAVSPILRGLFLCVARLISVMKRLAASRTPGGAGQGQEALMRRGLRAEAPVCSGSVFSVQQK